ncbi:LysR family transcriptional regulator [Arenimonas fontis]|uniref:LysR family transcriptional regulator n=1 Tax=Arenimonas fontis TaxID=2608255 RepID=A0A5B2Z9D0_9GAMM|nr:LysR family transcriptional regulator [Arenimonas fontis]
MARDLNDTLIFVKVVEQGSFTAAARQLGLPKTTVSRKVLELEARLGAQLLMRTTRRLGLTEAGTVYYEHCKRIARELEEAEGAVNQLQSGPRGWLRVTVPVSLGLIALGPLLTEFRSRYPEVRLDLVLSNDVLDLIGDEIDVALRFGSLPDSTLVARNLGSYRPYIYASPSYIARHGEPLTPEDLEHHHALVMPHHRRGQRWSWALGDGDHSGDFGVRPMMVANDPFALKPALLAGEGLMLATPMVVGGELASGCVRRVLPGWAGPIVELNAVFPRGSVLSPKVRAFVDFLLERMELRELALRRLGFGDTICRKEQGRVSCEELQAALAMHPEPVQAAGGKGKARTETPPAQEAVEAETD